MFPVSDSAVHYYTVFSVHSAAKSLNFTGDLNTSVCKKRGPRSRGFKDARVKMLTVSGCQFTVE